MGGITDVGGYMGSAGVWRLSLPAETGSRRPSFGVSEDEKMIETLGYGANIMSSRANPDLREYARWEDGQADAEWVLSTARRTHANGGGPRAGGARGGASLHSLLRAAPLGPRRAARRARRRGAAQ